MTPEEAKLKELSVSVLIKEIQLTQGYIALVDDEDYEKVSQYKWYAENRLYSWYARTTIIKTRKNIYLHRFILNVKPDEEVDHINGNGLDNRRCNLRIVTHQQNMMNVKKRINGSSKYRGVFWDKEREKWEAQIAINGKSCYLGLFTSEVEAAKAYNIKALESFGEYAKLNIIIGCV
jgi:hypothetical protein